MSERILDDVLGLIGHTPLIRLRNLNQGGAEIVVKPERSNPGGSIKDRIALGMIQAAEREGKLAPGVTIVEPTSGNTGIGVQANPDKPVLSIWRIQLLDGIYLVPGGPAGSFLVMTENAEKGNA